MTLDKRTRKQLFAHCGELHEDDCIDPREFFKPSRDRQKQNRKAKQLCRQVAQTLDLVLSGDCHDETLQILQVVSVVPAPDSSRLLVTLRADVPKNLFDREVILQLLNSQTGRLRSEVAASITRKRVPMLIFHVTGPTIATEEVDQ
jgi:ribosome-binding factor A